MYQSLAAHVNLRFNWLDNPTTDFLSTLLFIASIKQLSHQIACENPVFVRWVLRFSTIFRFDNLHICDIELIRSIYAVIKMFTRIETGTVQVL